MAVLGGAAIVIAIVFMLAAGATGFFAAAPLSLNPAMESFRNDWKNRFGEPTMPSPPPPFVQPNASAPSRQAPSTFCPDGARRPSEPESYGQEINGKEVTVTRFHDCHYETNDPQGSPAPAARVAQAPAPASAASNRHQTGKGNSQRFPAGVPVVGYKISLDNGRVLMECFLPSAPSAGTVLDGVWGDVFPGEQSNPCQ